MSAVVHHAPRHSGGPMIKGGGNVASASGKDETEPTTDRFFDPWRRPRSDLAKALVAEVIKEVQNYESHKGARTRARRPRDQSVFEGTIAAVICDLTHAHVTGATGGIAVSRSKETLARKSCYRSAVEGKQFPTILDRLSAPEMAFVVQEAGYQSPFGRNQRTLIMPGKRLLSRIAKSTMDASDFGRCPSEPSIILKADKEDHWDGGRRLEYETTEATTILQSRLETINAGLDHADIQLLRWQEDRGRRLDDGDRRLRRTFTRGSFQSGGRLFGGFWQQMKKQARLDDILIDGEQVVELDYGQMAPRMLYGLAGAVPGPVDAYLPPDQSNPTLYRDGFKKLFNSLLFATEPLKRKPQGTKDLLPRRPISDLVQLLADHHRPIAHVFGTGIGHEIQFRESQIMVEVLLRLQGLGIAALPIHDAVLVPVSAERAARGVMEKVFLKEVGLDACVRRSSATATYGGMMCTPPL